MKYTLLSILLLLRAHAVAAESPAPVQADGCVVLLHGLARTSASMHVMQKALTESGYRVVNMEYPSRELPIEELAPLAVGGGIDECRASGYDGPFHFVTHSLGGILVRYYFAKNPSNIVGRVVMLAPPNQGSNAADALRDIPGFDWLNGPAGSQLGKGEMSVPLHLGTPEFEFAVIAGNRSIDPVSSAVLDNPDDGKVSVADTRLDGMRDFRVMPVSHTYIMKDDDVIDLVRNFLRAGHF